MKKQEKLNNLLEANEDFIYLQDDGHDINQFTDIHWRIDGIDVWITTKKWWHKETGDKGNYDNLLAFIKWKKSGLSKDKFIREFLTPPPKEINTIKS